MMDDKGDDQRGDDDTSSQHIFPSPRHPTQPSTWGNDDRGNDEKGNAGMSSKYEFPGRDTPPTHPCQAMMTEAMMTRHPSTSFSRLQAPTHPRQARMTRHHVHRRLRTGPPSNRLAHATSAPGDPNWTLCHIALSTQAPWPHLLPLWGSKPRGTPIWPPTTLPSAHSHSGPAHLAPLIGPLGTRIWPR